MSNDATNQNAADIRRIRRTVRIVFSLFALVAVFALVSFFVNGSQSNDAANSAKSVAQCVNRSLASRNDPGQRDANAHVAFSKAQTTWIESLATVLSAPKPKQAEDYRHFLAELSIFINASVLYQQTLAADQADRNAHPLGKC